jgi:2-methylcitrate dehydratase PrpD
MIDLCKANRIGPDDVTDVFVGIPAVILGRLTIPKPIDVQAAQMSLPHSAALAVAMAPSAENGFALSVTDYESSLHDRQVKQIETLVRCEVDAEVEAATTAESVPARVIITVKDGTRHSTFVAAPKGSPSRPFTHADHVARFRRELAKRLTEKTCDEIVDIAEHLADLDRVTRITDLLAAAKAS